MSEVSNPRITEQVFRQFDFLRRSGSCNILDMNQVYAVSYQLGLKDLHLLVKEDLELPAKEKAYLEILRRQVFYTRKYKITR